jgi:hypothetical protein
MGIMDFFTGGGNNQNQNQPQQNQPQQNQQNQQQTPGNIPQNSPTNSPADGNTAANGLVPPNTDKSSESPLDQYADLWKNDPSSGDATPPGVFGNVDPQKFMEAAARVDFSKSIPQEQLQAIAAGGEGAMQAFASALNTVSQNVYAQSAFASTKIVEQAMARAKESFMSELPQHIKKQSVSDSLRAENPIFLNPAVQPIISALEAQLTVKFPNASASELQTMAKQYVEALGTSFAPKPKENPQTSGRAETDWNSFL